MKRILIVALLLLITAFQAETRTCNVVVGQPTAVAGCNPASDDVGDRTIYTGTNVIAANEMDCILYQASCTGTANTAIVDKHATDSDQVKICLYTAQHTSSHTPDAGDTLLGCTSGDTTTTEGSNTLTGDIGQAVTKDAYYWVCVLAGTGGFNLHYNSGGAVDMYYNTSSNYSSPPGTLTGSWTLATTTDFSAYVEID